MLQMCLNVFLFVYAFVYYKWTRPDMPRPFKLPGGVAGAVHISLPVVAISAAVGW